MTEISYWLDGIKIWFQPNQSQNIKILIDHVNLAPSALFDNVDSDMNSEALAYWFDACQRLSLYYQDQGEPEKAFSYLQFAYAKLQGMLCHPSHSDDIKRWSLKKIDRIIVVMVEFCQVQQEKKWQQESIQLINLHVTFMEGQNNLNLVYRND
ncbi:hypothetical protein C9J48_11430 [Photobacterium profundum]|uniref:Transcriptional regulator n=1 Tax=Photobacterium profundum 3TCK TaxID=314280 RepID=Q1Z2V6_9GAMM|nr:hypothetical protein [Photobacterium profundum]EAS42811.1 hypothetical protein P3TCK_08161 [Photobacterium profundum 3TCK]PSV62557.1 hypothetical protein C9J48_11430 [Photobacterium profundum]